MSQTAFPAPRTTDSTPGMSLRDYFAAHAMLAVLEHVYATARIDRRGSDAQWTNDKIADKAYMMADAMIARGAKE